MKKLNLLSSMLIAVICIWPILTSAQTTSAVIVDPTILKLKAAIEANSNNKKAHEELYRLSGEDESMIPQYEKWVLKFPKSALTHYYLGSLYSNTDMEKARIFFEKAAGLDPGMTEAWSKLYGQTIITGNDSLRRAVLQSAAKANPKDAQIALRHAHSYSGYEQDTFDSLSLDVVRRFPDSEEAANAFYTLAEDAPDEALKKIYLDQAYKLFLENQTVYGSLAAKKYFHMSLFSEPEKALSIALEMLRISKLDLLQWKHMAESARKMYSIQHFVKENKVPEAIEVLKSITVANKFANSYLNAGDFRELEASLYALNGEYKRAFDSIAVAYSSTPTRRGRTDLMKYGQQLNMDSNDVDQYIWTMRDKTSQVADTFKLIDLQTNEPVSLTDFRGKVVFITNWFPSCSPCRAEFPHFENVLKKFPNQVVYVGINGAPEQTHLVLPYLQGTKFTFLPLNKSKEDILGNLDASAYPTNYLIDQKGRIIFSSFRADSREMEEPLEMMIEELLRN